MNNYFDKNDEDLVKLSLKDADVFSIIIDRYREKLFLYIKRISNVSKEEAEDLLQEIFLKTYLNLNDYNPELKFSSWIYRISHNQVISYFRKMKARPEGNNLQLDDNLIDNLYSNSDILDDIDKNIDKNNILAVLNSLDKKYKEVLVLKFLEEKSYLEISDIIKKPQGTVASMINKAKSKFRKEIEDKNINF